jgi:L-threonylcarbamoyladenylate synthase
VPVLVVDPASCEAVDLAPAAAWLHAGGIVALPTDTFYGLAVDPRLPEAVARVFALKGRTAEAALPLIAGSVAQVEQSCGTLSAAARRLAAAYWPGPLSLILDAPPEVAPAVHGATGTVAIRVPAHPLARLLAEIVGYPLTATSANRSGEPPAMDATRLAALDAAGLFVLDGGATPGGAPSTIVDVRGGAPRLVRAGGIAWERVLESLRG